MVIEIISFSSDNKELFNKAMNIRFTVFTDEQGVDKDLEYDGLDFDAVHYLVTVDNKPVATARWRETDEGLKIERMAVLKEFRSYYYGKLLLKNILDELTKSKLKIYLHAQSQAVDFYRRTGFVIEGKEFVEADIKHFKMIYKMKTK